MIDLYQIGDTCRTPSGLPARSIGRGLALCVARDGLLYVAPLTPARGGEALGALPSDLEVAQYAVRVPWGRGW